MASLSISPRGRYSTEALWAGDEPTRPQLALLSDLGLKKIIVLGGISISHLDEYSLLHTLKKLFEQRNPNTLFFGATDLGQVIAPKLSILLDIGYISQATYIRLLNSKLQVSRPIIDSRLTEILGFLPESTGIIKTCPGSFEIPSGTLTVDDVTIDIERLPVETLPGTDTNGPQILESIPDSPETLDLEDAEVVIAGGRGLGSKEAFGMLEGLARVLGGVVAASRVAVDLGWAPRDRLVGQTGHKVSPDLYIACGISGASQHMAGIKQSRYILAINTDPYAPIFKHATWGIVGDVKEALPLLTRFFHEKLSDKRT